MNEQTLRSTKSLSIPTEAQKARSVVRTFLEMIKFEHTVFALPFAYAGALLAGRGQISLKEFFWITLAMAGARTAGMSLNRLIDQKQDAANPRTAGRALPAGKIGAGTVRNAVLISMAALVLASSQLNRLCLFLSPAAAFLLFGYSYLKRFTYLCHAGLGLVLACAPIGGWLAVAGHFSAVPFLLGAAVIFWLAGFDILYACQDLDFDRQAGLHSVPQKFGVAKALWISSFCHVLTFLFLAATGIMAQIGWPYDIGLILIGAILIYEHAILSPGDLSRLDRAFFQANAAISLLVLLSTWAALRFSP